VRSRLLAGVAVAILLAMACACDSAIEPHPTEACREAGAQCQLPDGPLGVCERAACAYGATEPCFQCTPQH
jgi:hypothetical protein